jgi:hypothetical protein
VLLPDDAAWELTLRNLSALYTNFLAAGVTHILLAEAVETNAELEDLRQAMPHAELVTCRRTASPRQCSNVSGSEPGMHQAQFVARSRTLHDTLEAARIEDFAISNDRGSITEVARDILHRGGWLP